jgi:DNA-binding transcriptional MerR regulator
MSITSQMDIEELDVEWINLILSARKLGISMDDIRAFLKSPAHPMQNVHIPIINQQMINPGGIH